MPCHRPFYSRRAERQLRGLTGELRLQVETHMENLSLLLGSLTSMDQALPRLRRDDEGEGFVTDVEGTRVFFTLDAAMRVLLVHGVEPLGLGYGVEAPGPGPS